MSATAPRGTQHPDTDFITIELPAICIQRRKSDGYFNGSVMTKDAKKEDLEKFLTGEYFLRYASARGLSKNESYYEIEIGDDKEKTIFINPKCVRCVAYWCSPECAAKIDDIIDAESGTKQQEITYEPINYNKKLTFLKRDSDYKISADSTRKFKSALIVFTFNSSMNVKQQLKEYCRNIKKGDKETYIFVDLKEMFEQVYNYGPEKIEFFNIKKNGQNSFEYKEGKGLCITYNKNEYTPHSIPKDMLEILDVYVNH